MTQTTEEVKTEPCGCAEKTTYDVAGKVVAQDLDHCVAHALSWAGSFLQHAGNKLLSTTLAQDNAVDKFTAVYADAGGKRVWQESPYAYPLPHQDDAVILREDKAYRIVKSVTAGKVYLFTVEECSPTIEPKP